LPCQLFLLSTSLLPAELVNSEPETPVPFIGHVMVLVSIVVPAHAVMVVSIIMNSITATFESNLLKG
jgi:hypothetical protein